MTKTLLIAAVAMLVLMAIADFFWLNTATKWLYRPRIGHLLADKPNMVAAVAFYLLYGVGVAALVLRPAVAVGSPGSALLWGAIFGLVAYGTYDLTNHATMRDWSPTVTLVDMAWGTALTGLTSAAGVWIAQKLA